MVSNAGRGRSSSGGTQSEEGYQIMADREERRRARRERHKEQERLGFAAIRMETLMGTKRSTRWDGRHLEQYAKPLSRHDPASEGRERLYTHPRPIPAISPDWRALYPRLLAHPPIAVYQDEKGLYPFSCVPHLPNVDLNDRGSFEARRSIETRRSMERRALYETIETKSWRTATTLGRSVQNPDNYPWPEQLEELEDCPNNDPRKGKCSQEVWRVFWNRHSEAICEAPPPIEI
eukprot:4648115-Amphidinium_carterae.2